MSAWGGPYSDQRASQELQHYLDHRRRHGFAPFAVVHGDLSIGDIGLQRLEDGRPVELLYRLASTAWHHGLAAEACDASLQYGFDALKLPEIVAVISESNLPSQRLAAKLGFVPGEPGTYYRNGSISKVVHPASQGSREPVASAASSCRSDGVGP